MEDKLEVKLFETKRMVLLEDHGLAPKVQMTFTEEELHYLWMVIGFGVAYINDAGQAEYAEEAASLSRHFFVERTWAKSVAR